MALIEVYNRQNIWSLFLLHISTMNTCLNWNTSKKTESRMKNRVGIWDLALYALTTNCDVIWMNQKAMEYLFLFLENGSLDEPFLKFIKKIKSIKIKVSINILILWNFLYKFLKRFINNNNPHKQYYSDHITVEVVVKAYSIKKVLSPNPNGK